jgi:hypothetical protein
VLAAGPDSINLALVLCGLVIDLVSMIEIEHDHLVDERELQSRKLTKKHFGREPLIVIINEVIKPDPVSRQADFTVRVPVQARGQLADQRFGAVHEAFSQVGPLMSGRRGSRN